MSNEIVLYKTKESEIEESKRIIANLVSFLKLVDADVRALVILEDKKLPAVIENDNQHLDAAAQLRKIVTRKKQIQAMRLNITRPIDAAKSEIVSFVNGITTRLEGLHDKIEDALDQYEEKLRIEKARKEQELFEEQLRLKRKAAIKAEREATKLEQTGDIDGAAIIRDLANEVSLAIPSVDIEVPKADGISFTTHWKFRITDASLIPREWMKADEVAIGKAVRASGDRLNIPGVQIYSEETRNIRQEKQGVTLHAEQNEEN